LRCFTFAASPIAPVFSYSLFDGAAVGVEAGVVLSIEAAGLVSLLLAESVEPDAAGL